VTRPARILIVDDEPMNLDLLEQELELLDHETVAAADGYQALERLDETIDCVLLDVMMPGLDGFEVLRRIRADPERRTLPVIMVSALSELDAVVRGIELGADDYLPKPFEPTLLKARISSCLERKRWADRERAYLAEIERERRRADELLHVILPAPAVRELKETGHVAPRRFEDVAVLFADLVGFTRYCENRSAERVVADLDALLLECERIIAAHGLEKIKSVGDGLIATANLLEPHPEPASAAARCGAELVAAAARHRPGWKLRVGIDLGPVVAGVVGRSKFGFDLWGDTVNIAARLSSFGTDGAVYLSSTAWRRLDGRARGQPLGPVALKGKGEIEVFRCEGLDDVV
jgi:adenylate cyclase